VEPEKKVEKITEVKKAEVAPAQRKADAKTIASELKKAEKTTTAKTAESSTGKKSAKEAFKKN